MKRIAISAATLALACLGMVADAKGAGGANDRFFVAFNSPNEINTPGPVQYHLNVKNDIGSGPNHFIRQIVVTVPAAFTLVNIPGTTPPSAITPPPGWKVQSITGSAGQPHVITFVTISSTDATLTAGKSVSFIINAQAAAVSGGCGSAQTYTWTITANQDINGGNGNTYNLRPGT